jgi:hypothetical protein
MSLQIDNPEDLRKLLASLDLKPANLEELKEFLQAVNRSYNPDAGRLRVAALLAVVPTSVSTGVAWGTSLFLMGLSNSPDTAWVLIPLLAIVWGAVALISSIAVVSAFLILRSAPGAAARNQAATRPEESTPSFALGDNRIKIAEGN